MHITAASIHLRRLLLTDAATCLAMGALLTAGAATLAANTAIPTALLMYVGIALLPIAAGIAIIACKATTSVPFVSVVVIGNVLWVAASLALMFGDWIAPNAVGHAFIGTQALVVAVLSVLEQRALRRVSGGALVPARE